MHIYVNAINHLFVALLARAWIEISMVSNALIPFVVALLARAWIEILNRGMDSFVMLSLSLRERGLKCSQCPMYPLCTNVALLARAWIEI